MAASCQNVAQTLAAVAARRPALEPVLRAFEDVLTARAALAAELSAERADAAGMAEDGGPRLPDWSGERAEQGRSLLAGVPLTGLRAAVRRTAETLLPLLCAKGDVAAHKAALEAFFLAPAQSRRDRRDALAEAVLAGDASTFQRLAAEAGLPPEVLEFVAEFVLSPPLRALAAQAGRADKTLPGMRPGRGGRAIVRPVLPFRSWVGWTSPLLTRKTPFFPAAAGKNICIAPCAAQAGRSGVGPARPAARRATGLWKFCAKAASPGASGLTGAPSAKAIVPQWICANAAGFRTWTPWPWA